MPRSDRTRASWLAGPLILAGGALLGLILLELTTRQLYGRGGMQFGIEMWEYARLLKRVSSNPEMGHEHRPSAHAHLMGVDVEINGRGLRDRTFEIPKPHGILRIMVLGDSMTFGWGVPVEATYPKVLERWLNERRSPETGRTYEVVNTGVGNYNTAQQGAYFSSRGLEYQPDLVILAFFVNDAEPTPHPNASWLDQNSYLYVLARSAWDTLSRQRGWKPEYEAYYRDLYREDAPGWLAWQTAFAELVQLCGREGIEIVLVQVPELHDTSADRPFVGIYERTAEVARGARVPVIDLHPGFEGMEPPSLWVSRGDAHPNVRAHRIMAKALLADLGPVLTELEGEPSSQIDSGS